MKVSELKRLFFILNNTYQGFNGDNDEKFKIWFDYLQDIPFELAHQNLRRHTANSKFPPTIADIAKKPEEDQHQRNNEIQREETMSRFAEMETWKLRAAPPPWLKERDHEKRKI